jgi:transposase
VHRFNDQGADGLINIPSPGVPPKLNATHLAFLARIVEEDPISAVHGVVRWRACDLIMRAHEEFDISVSDDTIYRALKDLGFSHLSARPKAYKQDPEAVETLKKLLYTRGGSPREARARHTGRSVVPGRNAGRGRRTSSHTAGLGRAHVPVPRTISAPSRPTCSGAVCPDRGVGAALVPPACNSEAMQLHLDEITTKVAPGAHAILILDQAGWHGAKELRIPTNISLLPLPPRSPELNSQENIWQFMRQNRLSNRTFKSFDDIVDHCCYAWNTLIGQP